MNHDKSNFIASLLDEAPSKEKIDLLIADAELKAQWERYHLVQDVLSDHAPEQINLNLASRICAAIEDEAPLTMPVDGPLESPSSEKSSNVTFVERWGLPRLRKPEVLKQVAGLAIAASVTAVTIFSYQNLISPVATTVPDEPRVADAAPIVPTQPSMASSGRLSAKEKRRFMEALIRHEQLATEPGYHAVLEIRKQLEEMQLANKQSQSSKSQKHQENQEK